MSEACRKAPSRSVSVGANKVIDTLPLLVQGASKAIAGSNSTILNGADGVNDVDAGCRSGPDHLRSAQALDHSDEGCLGAANRMKRRSLSSLQ
jgi:hypothetical protein